jgi:hypothetical protein
MSPKRRRATKRIALIAILLLALLALWVLAPGLSAPAGASAPDRPVLTAIPPSPSASTSASFGFTGVAGAAFECRLDSGPFTACTSPTPYAGLPLGAHVFGVRATKSGKTSGETMFAWVVALPGVTITSRPSDPSSSTGASFGFSVSPANAAAACSLDGGPYVPCAGPTSYSGLAEGAHVFRARASGPAGSSAGTGPVSSVTWTVDTTPPLPPEVAGPPAPPLGWASTTATFVFGGSSTDVVGYRCRIDAGATVACGGAKTYTGLAQGTHTLDVRSVDAAGNVSLSAGSASVLVDTVAPTTPAFSQKPPDPSSTATSTFAWTSADPSPGSGIAYFLCSKENGSLVPCASPHTYHVQTTNNGQHQLAVVTVDLAGNTSPAASYKWKVGKGSPARFAIEGEVTGLVPGVWLEIPIRITNPNDDPITVTSLTVSVTGTAACGGGNFETQPSSVPFVVPGNATDYHVPQARRPHIRLANLATNQDSCKNQTVALHFDGSANGP